MRLASQALAEGPSCLHPADTSKLSPWAVHRKLVEGCSSNGYAEVSHDANTSDTGSATARRARDGIHRACGEEVRTSCLELLWPLGVRRGTKSTANCAKCWEAASHHKPGAQGSWTACDVAQYAPSTMPLPLPRPLAASSEDLLTAKLRFTPASSQPELQSQAAYCEAASQRGQLHGDLLALSSKHKTTAAARGQKVQTSSRSPEWILNMIRLRPASQGSTFVPAQVFNGSRAPKPKHLFNMEKCAKQA